MKNDKLPPHNIDAEENIIGSLLIDGELIYGLGLAPADFYHEIHRFCYTACLALADRGVNINQITLAQELNEQGKLETIGGVAYLSHLVSACVSSMDCRYYADIVKRQATYRQMIVAGDQITELGYGEGPDVAETLSQADELILSLRKDGIASPIITPDERVMIAGDRYEGLFKAEAGVALATGLRDLDALIGGGFYAAEMVVVGSRPGIGKTTFIMNIANHIATNNSVLVCSAEMPMEGITDRDIAGVLGIPTNEVRRGGYSEEVFVDIIGKGLQSLKDRQLYFYSDAPLTTAKILQAGINMQLRHGLDLIVVDYLGLLADDYGRSQYEQVGYISRQLKGIGRKLGIPILVAHQLSRALEARTDKRPQLSDLRDSGKIEEDADLVLFLYRESYYQDDADNVSEIIIAKQRQGEAHRIVKVYYDRAKQLYQDLARG